MAACGRFLSGPAGRVVQSFDGLPRRPEASQLRWSRHLVGRHLFQHVRQLGWRYRTPGMCVTPGLCQRRRLWWQMAATPAAICHCDTIERQFCAAGVGSVTVYGHVLAHMPRTDGPRVAGLGPRVLVPGRLGQRRTGAVQPQTWPPASPGSASSPGRPREAQIRAPGRLQKGPAGWYWSYLQTKQINTSAKNTSTEYLFLWKWYLANKCFVAALSLYGSPE